MGYAACDKTTGKVLGWVRYDPAELLADPVEHVVIPADGPPDPETQRWDGANGLRGLNAQETADRAVVAANPSIDEIIDALIAQVPAPAQSALEDVKARRAAAKAARGRLDG